VRPLRELLKENERVVAFVGAGGKTSLIYTLARQLSGWGHKVLITTTTKMHPPARNLLLLDSVNKIPFYKHLTVGKCIDPDSGKLLGVHPDEIQHLRERFGAQFVLVEADGAAGRPVKAPAGHEPVVPSSVDLVVGVMGLDALGMPVDEETVFRLEHFLKVTGLAHSDEISPDSLRVLAAHPEGLFKGCPENARKVAFFNKADAYEFIAGGRREQLSGKPDAQEPVWETVSGSAHQGWFLSRE
jgi:probable selenium-dependent hydroxylase accessory protein YqeC